MEDGSISVQWFGVGCSCRCRHCLLASGANLSTVTYEDARAVVERFLRWRDQRGAADFLVDFTIGYSYDFPQVFDYVRFRRQLGVPGSDSLALNGIRRRGAEELMSLMTALRDAGIADVGLTFYGGGSAHDEFARRPGDYAFLLQVARTALECGMQRSETLFLSKSSAPALATSLNGLDSLPPPIRRSVVPWDYRGRAKVLEDARPTIADFEDLPASLAECVNRDVYRTEEEWIRLIASEQVPPKRLRHYFVSVWADTLEELQSTECGQILVKLRSAEGALVGKLPSLPDLAQAYGEQDGQRVYALRDLEWKWQDQWFAEHPELSVSARYDDLAAGVRYK